MPLQNRPTIIVQVEFPIQLEMNLNASSGVELMSNLIRNHASNVVATALDAFGVDRNKVKVKTKELILTDLPNE